MFRPSFRWLLALLVLVPVLASAQSSRVEEVRIVKDATGQRLQVDGRDFMVLGMNWDYFPIGTNYTYSLWNQPDEFIKKALDYEMGLLQNMGVNSIRVYTGIPPKWVEYIWENYGIYTILNHPMLRYGYTLDGVWIPAERIDYSDPALRAAVTEEIVGIIEEFKDTPGVLMWLLGNENNYQLSWSSTEIEALPEGERHAARAVHLYTLWNDVTKAIHEVDRIRPVAMCNGDLQYVDLIAEHCQDVDIFGTNVYRGISARDLYEEVAEKLDKPIVYAEFGSDAFNAKTQREDQIMQAYYLIGQWQEIYEQSAGKGKVGNAIGGMTFQWTDGWWKYQQTENLDVHDTHASWPNGGYYDIAPGENNMNEEWWGIAAKGQPGPDGFFEVYPRAAYYALKQAYQLDPYGDDTTLAKIDEHFSKITPAASALEARGDTAARTGGESAKLKVKSVRAEFETFYVGGKNSTLIASLENNVPGEGETIREVSGEFDHLESYFVEFEANPSPRVKGNISLNITGNVPDNPIEQIFYENRGQIGPAVRVIQPDPFVPGAIDSNSVIFLPRQERVKVYRASVNWDDDWFSLYGFYREGHLHWGYEGDFFGFYPDAFYGENIDIYNGEAPLGVEVTGKKSLEGMKLAFGPELWWGANPTFLIKYQRQFGKYNTTAIFQEDFTKALAASGTSSSAAIPDRQNRRLSLQTETTMGPFGVEAGLLWSGDKQVGDTFDGAYRGDDGRFVYYTDTVRDIDTLGGKLKLTWQRGRINWYGQSTVQGLVARGGYNPSLNYTGWALRDTGEGNVRNVISGFTYQLADSWQIGPNFMWQKPFEDPIPREVLLTSERSDPVVTEDGNLAVLGEGIGSRGLLNAPFHVRGNRETIGSEVILVYDPTPATWMWQWDNDIREDADLAFSLRFTHRHQPTTQDANVFVGATGDLFQFGGAPPAKDLWELHLRTVSKINATSRVVLNAMGGPAQPNGSVFDDDSKGDYQFNRTIKRFHGDVRYINSKMSWMGMVKVNDWGPYDYHRDFNLTYPLQLIGDVSVTLGTPKWFADSPQTRAGVRFTWRRLNEFSDRYPSNEYLSQSNPEIPDDNMFFEPDFDWPEGEEWELRTYVHFAM